jgi:SAM-dependent methyltransferase
MMSPRRKLVFDQWRAHGLPERLDGKSFLDIGCWEGDICVEAMRRGAKDVVGIDFCVCDDLLETLDKTPFTFIQMDVLSDKLLELPEFDIVHASGVLYHVENPVSFLYRLRKLCHVGSALHIETSCAAGPGTHPVLVFHPRDSYDSNPSNWASPNERWLIEMLTEVGLTDIEVTSRAALDPVPADFGFGRIAVKGIVSNTPAAISQKMLPRRPRYMSTAKSRGNRIY